MLLYEARNARNVLPYRPSLSSRHHRGGRRHRGGVRFYIRYFFLASICINLQCGGFTWREAVITRARSSPAATSVNKLL